MRTLTAPVGSVRAMEPEWVEHSIWWHLYPLGFLGADPTGADRTPGRSLADLVPWLDHAQELGCSGVALGPIFASSTHGYDTLDHFAIDERLGTEADFDTFVAACHERGLRIMLDGVFNHVGRQHPDLLAALEGGPQAPTAGMFALEWDEHGRASIGDFEGHDLLAALDHGSPQVRRLVTDVMTHWCAKGVDAWRLDAAYAVPADFWAGVLPAVREAHPEVYVVGEVIHGDYVDIVERSGMDAVTQYELWKAIWSGLEERNLYETAWTMGRHEELLDRFVPWTFVGNHDVTRIASQLSDERMLAHALVLLLTLGGTPAIYAGDEHAFRGVKEEREGGDDEIRPPFPDTPEGLSSLGEPTYHLHQELIGLRRRHPWLHRARHEQRHLANEQLLYVMSPREGATDDGSGGDDGQSRDGDDGAPGGERLVVALNLADDGAVLPADPEIAGLPVLAGQAEATEDGLLLPPLGWAVLG